MRVRNGRYTKRDEAEPTEHCNILQKESRGNEEECKQERGGIAVGRKLVGGSRGLLNVR